MGCVQSSQTRRSARAKQARRQKLYEQQSFHPPIKNTSSLPPKVKEDAASVAGSLGRLKVSSPGGGGGLGSGVVPSSTTPATPNGENNEEIQFRRQHFDRNSMLRHSKKRRKSSASASPNVAALNKSLNTSAVGQRALSPTRLNFIENNNSSEPRKVVVAGLVDSPLAKSQVLPPKTILSPSKPEESKQRIPSPEQVVLQRQNSGRLI
eukprot:TRINITY_DN182_c3_g1_i1.p1 TRINITY_DN182_c3_g1~~TRINITY_DN182_c3_g1_i1.p1  ORF type:complete len:208 (+),score=70.36 TRINITY_DN182_c3_g1_i1:331-954(+)